MTDYGFIETTDGQDIYFHRNSVAQEGFDKLAQGAEVRLSYVLDESEFGAQATTVTPIGKHHLP